MPIARLGDILRFHADEPRQETPREANARACREHYYRYRDDHLARKRRYYLANRDSILAKQKARRAKDRLVRRPSAAVPKEGRRAAAPRHQMGHGPREGGGRSGEGA